MGDFGTVTLGSGPDVAEYGLKANDILGGNPISTNQTLSYESPSFSGFGFGVNVIADADRNPVPTFHTFISNEACLERNNRLCGWDQIRW